MQDELHDFPEKKEKPSEKEEKQLQENIGRYFQELGRRRDTVKQNDVCIIARHFVLEYPRIL